MVRKRRKKTPLPLPLPLNLVNGLVILLSATFCTLALSLRLPGMNLAGVGPHWLLVWLVAWSMKRGVLQGLLGGIAVGLLQDSLTAPHPSHVVGLVVVGVITGSIDKKRLVSEEFASVALIVFCMAALVEVIMALQLSWMGNWPFLEIWQRLPQTALSSAILSSLWTPVVYYPLNHWWDRLRAISQPD